MIDRINTIRENAERILSSGLKGPQGCAERIITALAALEAEMREPEWIDGVPHWTPALIARVKQLAAEIDAPPAQQAQPTEPICPTCKGSGEGGSYLVPGTMANFVDGPCRDCGGSGLDGQASAEAVPSSCTHALKLLPEYFADVKTGTKTFELRKDDRGFKVGDVLRLKEWSEPTGFTGKQELRVVTSVLRGPVYGLADGFVILSIASPQQAQAEAVASNSLESGGIKPQQAEAVPQGYVLVPVEPTPEMEMAWDDANGDGAPFHAMYATLLAAAPQQKGGT